MSDCHPHDWRKPMPFDTELECRRCGRELVIEDCEYYRLNAIARAHGPAFAQGSP